ncbi:MAG: hypothetical protein LBE32_03075 [Burkholderiales bacterium]|jgi:hypothetical protein|nr:hypothetical protein [Burkholderiales bacterium]
MTNEDPRNTDQKSLLDDLRMRAEGNSPPSERNRLSEAQIRNSMDQLLWHIHGWLEEIARYLEKLRPPVAHEFRFGNLMVMRSLTLEQSFVSYRRQRFGEQELLDHVELFYRLACPSSPIIRVSSTSANEIETRLRVAGLAFENSPETDQWRAVRAVQFKIVPEIKTTIRIEPDYVQHKIGVRLSNVDRFEIMQMVFSPSLLDEEALEDLVRLMLGENTAFLKRAPWVPNWRPTRPSFTSVKPTSRYIL